jgi:hypothetical protein
MALAPALNTILARIATTVAPGVAGVAGVARDVRSQLSMVSAATPVTLLEGGSGVAGVTRESVLHLPREGCSSGGAAQGVENTLFTECATPATPAPPQKAANAFLNTHFFPGTRGQPPCRHCWHQEGKQATCQVCQCTVPILPRERSYDAS